MSLYVKVFNNFYTHRKTAKLRAMLGDCALWIPPRLWAYAAENQPDGCFQNYSANEIALLIGYTGNPESMLQALLQASFMDENPLRIHDWQDHNSYHVTFAERARVASLKRWEQREKGKGKEKIGEGEDNEKIGEEASIASSNASSILVFLNEQAGRAFRFTDTNLKFIKARLEEPGVDLDGCKKMISRQVARWKGTEQSEYLRPETLFNKTKFDSYYAARDLPVENSSKPAQLIPDHSKGF